MYLFARHTRQDSAAVCYLTQRGDQRQWDVFAGVVLSRLYKTGFQQSISTNDNIRERQAASYKQLGS